MRVAHTIASLASEHGGPSRTVPALCEALVEIGVSARIITFEAGSQHGAENALSTRLQVASSDSRFRVAPVRKELRDCLRKNRTQLLHDHGVWLLTNHAAVTASHELSLPIVISPRGMLEPWSLQHRALKKRLAWWLYQRRDLHAATVLHATSQMEADNFREIGLRQPITVIPNGVNVVAVPSATAPPRERMALFLSRIHPKKGLLTLVQSWAMTRPEGWHVVIAGPDENGHQAEVAAAVNEAGLGDVFSFAGQVEGERKQALFQRASLFVLPTHSENFGVVIAEALASGIPVITTKGTPWADLETHQCGWWADLGAAPFASALRQATQLSDAERVEMGRRGRELVTHQFAWPQIATEMRAVYEWALGDAPVPGSVQID